MDFSLEKSFETPQSSNQSSYQHVIIRSLSIYALILVIVGTLGNLLAIIILCRRNLRRHVTMRYLIAVSIFDTVSLYGWNLNNFYKFTISSNYHNIEEISLVHCRFLSYMSFVGLQLSSWCLAAVSIDRCLSLHFLTWKQTYGKLSRAKYHIAILTVICLLLNSHILFLNGYRTGRSPNSVKCYATETNPYYIFPQWERVHLVVYNLFPFCIMCFCNTFIIYKTIRSARIRVPMPGHSSRNRQISTMLILVTFAFVLLTLPSCIYFVFFRHRMSTQLLSRSARYLVQIGLGSVQFTSHAINFFLYCFSTRNFREELNDFIGELCFGKISLKSSTSTRLTRNTTIENNRQKSRLERQFTLEHQQTGHDYALEEIQSVLINDR